jgi:NADH-quinone oxidoreductase subunit J
MIAHLAGIFAVLAALPTWQACLACPSFWALACGAVGLWLLLPTRLFAGAWLGGLLLAASGALFAYDLPRLGLWPDQIVFWLLALVTLGGGVAMIVSQSPVYSAIWFALSLLGTAGLYFYNGAQFLGVATIVVYAGAIVVTFLFVIMLAQPEGHSRYDRLTWGGAPKVLGVIAAGLLLGILLFMTDRMKAQAQTAPSEQALAQAHANLTAPSGVLAEKHMANLGRRLWTEHLISVELAGTLLLVALVGAVAIVHCGRSRLAERIEEALR